MDSTVSNSPWTAATASTRMPGNPTMTTSPVRDLRWLRSLWDRTSSRGSDREPPTLNMRTVGGASAAISHRRHEWRGRQWEPAGPVRPSKR